MAEKLTIGFIGCGGMAGAHVNGFRELWLQDLRDFEIVACCDIVEEKAAKMAADIAEWQGTKPRVYQNFEQMLEKEPDMMAVDIITLHRNHHTITEKCFEAGKHVTIEKPLAFTLRAGKQMLAAAEKSGKVFQVAENYRRAPDNRAVKWALDSGMIGDLRQIYWIDVEERLWYWTWRDHIKDAGGGWPLDGGVHFADLFRYFIGEAESVYCSVKQYNPHRYENPEKMEGPINVDVEDTTFGVINFENNVLGHWTYSLAAPGHKWSQRVVYGDQGSIDLREGLKTRTDEMAMADLIKLHHEKIGPDETEKLFPRGITDTIATELWEFVQAVLKGTPLEIDGLEGYKDQALSESLYESDALGRPVTMNEVESLEAETYQARLNKDLEGLKS